MAGRVRRGTERTVNDVVTQEHVVLFLEEDGLQLYPPVMRDTFCLTAVWKRCACAVP